MEYHRHEDLLQRVLHLTYRQLLADARHQPAGALPRRFATLDALHATKAMIERLCQDHGAESEFIEYVSTRWLGQFEPVLN